ncbi:FAD-dependent oxidoreductase [Phaeovulum sp.]|uniref:FAD-dependent oxidoreductase n=1 Tax=Phaeovulum sp. TaxID=2934796 RepID=UPI0027318A42|nr:FAD-dependent oxidoreductase [Phaeovulum sp.]MDP1669833.1 FAD-dependent monooxygenase [Phaeovulum sp.]MDZ4118751.1 FAD-dependent monooxygenase [Phaeovulum sp.]
MLVGRKVTVLGAGIAGLAAARALALRGARVTVYEQSDTIREVGAGLQISPNGMRVLRALGLAEGLAAVAPRGEAVELIDGPSGTRVVRMSLARGEYRFVHRGALIALLAEGARAAGVQFRFLQEIDRVLLGAHPPRFVTAQGAEIEAEVLIGSDGLHSRVRAALNGAAMPFFTHQVAWRAVIAAEPDAAPVAQVFMGQGRHLVSYPLGRGLRNIVAVEERRRWVEESWNLRDDPMTLRAAFREFCPKVRGWLASVEEPMLWGLFRHPVAVRWHGHDAAIMGDAAHPTLPFLAQGAVMALEDAWVLADRLALHETTGAAFAAYKAARAPRCARIVEAANANARNYHLSGLRRTIAHAGLRAASALAPDALLNRFDWVHGQDVTEGAGG